MQLLFIYWVIEGGKEPLQHTASGRILLSTSILDFTFYPSLWSTRQFKFKLQRTDIAITTSAAMHFLAYALTNTWQDVRAGLNLIMQVHGCLLYTSDAADE